MDTLSTLFRPYTGILAADDRPSSLIRRFESYGITPTEAIASRYRELLFSTPNLERTISGVILSEDVFATHTTEDVATPQFLRDKGIVVGVKVDEGLAPYEGSDILQHTKGLDLLEEKCVRYAKEGVGFVKWRAVIPPLHYTDAFIAHISEELTEYACCALRHGLVPIVEPEVSLAGDVPSSLVEEVLSLTLTQVLSSLRRAGCSPHDCILKTSFVAEGLAHTPLSADVASARTLDLFRRVGLDSQKGFYGIVFLSGGLSSEVALEYIQHITTHATAPSDMFSRPLTFSYGRALQGPALLAWQGEESQFFQAQIAFTQVLQHAIKRYKGPEEVALAGG